MTTSLTHQTPTTPTDSDRATGDELATYLALAIALCWAVAMPGLLGAVPVELNPALVPVAQLTPLLATIPSFVARRPRRIVDVLALRWNRSWRWVGVGIGAVTVIAAIQLGLGLAFGWRPNAPDAVGLAAAAVLPVLLMQTVFAFGEETGWRGWLVTRARHLGFVGLAVLSALAWVVWHIPAVVLFPELSLAESAAYLLGIASWAPFFVALRLVSGSVWPAVITHGAVNSVRLFFLNSVAGPNPVNWAVEASGWALWILAAVVLVRVAPPRP